MRELMNLLFFSRAYAIYTAPKYGGSVFMERGNNAHVVRNNTYTRRRVELIATVALTK